MDRLVSPSRRRMSVLVGFVVTVALLAAVWASPSAQPPPGEPPKVQVNLSDDCIEGFHWPSRATIRIEVRDSGGNVVYPASGDPPVRVSADSNGHFVEDDEGFVMGDCNRVPDLRPGMKVTASDGATTKELVLHQTTFDQLDPVTDTATGTAPQGSLPPQYSYNHYFQVLLHSPGGGPGFEAAPPISQAGSWFVDFGALGANVEVGSGGEALVLDSDLDSTWVELQVTGVSLSASVPAGPASVVGARAAATTVVRRGSLVRLSGKLSAATRVCVRRKRVKLFKVRGKKRKPLKSGRTNRRGRYSFVRRVRRTTRFQVRYAGNKRCQRSKSRVKRVRVIQP